MKSEWKITSRQEWLSFIGVFLITIGDYFCYSWIDVPFRHIIGVPLVVAGAIILLIDVVKNIKNKVYTPKQLKIIGVLVLLGALVWHRLNVFYGAIVIALHFIDKDLKFLFKSLFISMVFGMSLIIFLNLIGVIPDFICTRESNGETLYRYGLGFRQPNVLFRFYVALVMCGTIALKNNKYFLIGSFLIGLMLYKFTYSRMGFIVLTLLVILCLLPKDFRKKIAFNKYTPYFFVGGFIISIVIGFLLNGWDWLNSFLSGRPAIWNTYLKDVGFLGRFSRIDDMPLDNIYLHILSYGGIYGLVFYMVVFYFAFKKSNVANNYNLFMIFFITLAYGFIENFSGQNESMMLILLIIMLLDKDKMKEIDDDYVYEKSSN